MKKSSTLILKRLQNFRNFCFFLPCSIFFEKRNFNLDIQLGLAFHAEYERGGVRPVGKKMAERWQTVVGESLCLPAVNGDVTAGAKGKYLDTLMGRAVLY